MAVMVSRPRQECRQRVIKMMLVINNVLLLLRERGGDTSHLLQFQAAVGRDVVISRHQVVTGQLSSGTTGLLLTAGNVLSTFTSNLTKDSISLFSKVI